MEKYLTDIMFNFLYLLILPVQLLCQSQNLSSVAGSSDYLSDVKTELRKEWPANRTVNLVFHGHSVPAGYFKTPVVNTLGSYPFQVLKKLKEQYPYAVINIINTAIGGENSKNGAKRFKRDVLIHKPDVVFIDYALNDIGLGPVKSKKAWKSMIKCALKRNIKVILLTPSPDQRINILEPDNDLEKHAQQIRELSEEMEVGLADSYSVFKQILKTGGNLSDYMSQVNHPNDKGNSLIADEILKYFK